MRRGTNFPAVGGYNQSLVLDLIRRSDGGVSRVELAARTGLSAQTLTNITRRLIEDGLISETGKSTTGLGKPRTILQLDARSRFAVGVHLDPTVITHVLLDLAGTVIARSQTATPAGTHPDETLRRVTASVDAIIQTAGVPRDRIVGLGIAVPGPFDAERGTVFDPPRLETWHDVPLGESLAASTSFPTLVEKDVTAAIVAEGWTSSESDTGNELFFYYGTGTGGGLSLDGSIVRGASGNAGDIGHLIVDPDGPLCRCGKRGCMGDSVAPVALVEAAIAGGILTAPVDGVLDAEAVDALFTELLAAADSGSADAAAIMTEAGRRIARGILGIASILDLDSVVFGGPFWDRAATVLMEVIPAAFASDPALMLTHEVAFRTSLLKGDVAAVGAACLVLDRAFSPRPADMLIGA